MQQLTTLDELRQWRFSHGQHALTLVPTMGALHDGHKALIAKACSLTSHVIVSIFVNPAQFGPGEDLDQYPRTLQADLDLCRSIGVAAVYTPTAAFMYPRGVQTTVVPPSWLTEAHCGLEREGHFTGVATIVLKLLLLIQPVYAVFGTKDAQQLAVINRMVLDLNVPVEIMPVATVREPDGLALSSRNRYLTTGTSRHAALILIHTLKTLDKLLQAEVAEKGPEASVSLSDMHAIRQLILEEALATSPTEVTWDYLNPVDAETFEPQTAIKAGTLLLGAIRVKENDAVNVRLIDNWLLG